MIALTLCLIAFAASFLAGRRSLGLGLLTTFVFGYFYGILRANLLTAFSHFIFDAALMGFYLSQPWRSSNPDDKQRRKQVVLWTTLLVLWPVLLVVMPFQPFLISLVGLRGNIYFLFLLVFGARLKEKDLTQISVGLVCLDLIALVFAAAEYIFGLPRFYPYSPVTEIIYNSFSVGDHFHRIPATFANAHAYGGTMVATMPYLVGLWTGSKRGIYRLFGMIGIPAALLGILLSATRSNFVLGCAMVGLVLFTTQMKAKHRVLFLIIIAGVAFLALKDVRLQRFKTLDDADTVTERIGGSVNRSFWEILADYPMGNGLGGGGTSIPYFLQGQVRNPVGMENEYARILAEEGIIGLILWISFLIWFVCRYPIAFAKGPWMITRRIIWGLTVIGFTTAVLGLGALTAIPQTVLLMLGMGWVAVPTFQTSLSPTKAAQMPLRRSRVTYALARR